MEVRREAKVRYLGGVRAGPFFEYQHVLRLHISVDNVWTLDKLSAKQVA
jgi:hypothetical protein